MSAPGQPRVLLLHNRYRFEGGEERSLALQQRALANAGIEHRLLERRSADASQVQAAAALLRGGAGEDEVAAATRELGADIVHAHNMQPLIGPRGLAAPPPPRAPAGVAPPNPPPFFAGRGAARGGAAP